ncbi:MAG: hypothetical protein CM15mP64_7780 [Candidatus Neomarinimicrobiota bacterium]|nr:MAG: hypothetical protein CM15mP64_7780 [Candidatus Neomarinimicrobiota bacterium]
MEKIVVATNKKAYHEYNILEQFEAGIQLKGSEVKSIREGKASLKQSYVLIGRGRLAKRGAHIQLSHTGRDIPVRNRKNFIAQRDTKNKFKTC